jgi:multidrug resistance efflux pump
MSSEASDQHDEKAAPAPAPPEDSQPSYRALKILIGAIVVILIWTIVSDRLTPYTSTGRFQAFVIPVVPDVSGYIQDIPVGKYTVAEVGDVLLQIEPKRFELAVQVAEAALEVAGQQMGAGTADVASATARLVEAQVGRDEARLQTKRVLTLFDRGVVPQAQADEANSIVAAAEARTVAAEAELERQKQLLGSAGEDNPRVQLALANLEAARLNLSRTTIKAHTRGVVGSLYIDEGAFATAGQPVTTFITLNDFWIDAYMTENNLGRIKPGLKAEILFDVYPGQIFQGKVKKIAPGVSTGKKSDLGELSVAQKSSGWLRSPQRFIVVVEVTDPDFESELAALRHNSQVDVIVYTGDGFFWNTLGRLWIRLVGLLSYAY